MVFTLRHNQSQKPMRAYQDQNTGIWEGIDRKSQTKELTAHIFNDDGEEIGTGKIFVEYSEVGLTTYISSIERDAKIHIDDLHSALREEFKNYEI